MARWRGGIEERNERSKLKIAVSCKTVKGKTLMMFISKVIFFVLLQITTILSLTLATFFHKLLLLTLSQFFYFTSERDENTKFSIRLVKQ